MTNGSSSESYTLDGVGNRTASHRSASYSYQPYNRMTATATATMNFDANGNLIQKSEGSNYWRYGWDYENRMTFAATRRQTARYRYDALGRRVHRYFAGNKENTKFVYDGLDVLVDENSGTLTKYLNGGGIDKTSSRVGRYQNLFDPPPRPPKRRPPLLSRRGALYSHIL